MICNFISINFEFRSIPSIISNIERRGYDEMAIDLRQGITGKKYMLDSNLMPSSDNRKFTAAHLFSVFLALCLILAVYRTAGLNNALIAMVGVMIGLTLVLGNFGFTGGWVAWIKSRDGRGLRAQMIILGLASIIFYPILAQGSLFGADVRGFVSPIGIAPIIGSFIFGIGMQLGGCCASGALSWAGAGSARVFITLFGFIVGSVWGAYDIEFWRSLPGVPVSLTSEFGVMGGLSVTLLICAGVATSTLVFEKKRHGKILSHREGQVNSLGWRRLINGPWSIIAVILLLVLANFLTLYLAGRPWGVTSAFVLWGSKTLTMSGVDITGWYYWQNPTALERSVFFDVTSVMNFGILMGSFVAAIMMGTFKPEWNISTKMIAVSIIGGLMLGYGARIANGCNIGAFFSGVSSASLSGWVWFIFAFCGNIFGWFIRKRLNF